MDDKTAAKLVESIKVGDVVVWKLELHNQFLFGICTGRRLLSADRRRKSQMEYTFNIVYDGEQVNSLFSILYSNYKHTFQNLVLKAQKNILFVI